MKKFFAFALAAAAVLNSAAAFAFSDTANSPYSAEIEFFEQAGILHGKEGDAFFPDDTLTRAEAAKFLYDACFTPDAAGSEISETEYFTDVTSGFWAAKEINYLFSYGVIAGFGDGTFRPDEPVTGAQLLTMCAQITGYYAFADESLGWEEKYSQIGEEYGFLENIDIDTSANITRAETAKIVYNAVNLPIARTTSIELDENGQYVPVMEIMDGSNGTELETLWIEREK